MIQWCYEIQYDDKIITLDNIKNSFTKSGISFPMNGSKDEELKFLDDNEIYHGNTNKNKNKIIINNINEEQLNELNKYKNSINEQIQNNDMDNNNEF